MPQTSADPGGPEPWDLPGPQHCAPPSSICGPTSEEVSRPQGPCHASPLRTSELEAKLETSGKVLGSRSVEPCGPQSVPGLAPAQAELPLMPKMDGVHEPVHSRELGQVT